MMTSRSRTSYLGVALALAATGAFAAPDPTGVMGEPLPSRLDPSETLVRAKEYVGKMQDTLRDVVGLQEQTKKQKDIIKLNCVNDKLVQVKGHISVADSEMGTLNEVLAKHDEDGRVHSYRKLGILHQKVLVLGTEARNCIGDDLSYIGALSVVEDIDPAIPQKDYTAFDYPALDTTRPPFASSF